MIALKHYVSLHHDRSTARHTLSNGRLLFLSFSLLISALICFFSSNPFHQTIEAVEVYRSGITGSLSRHLKAIKSSKVYPPPPPPDEDEYVAICMLIKDDAPLLDEFLTYYYHHLGVRRFYIYDDGSEEMMYSGGKENITYSIPKSALTFTYIPEKNFPWESKERNWLQQTMMNRCIDDHGPKHHWMGLIDTDEFLEMRSPEFPTLLSWLKHWEADPEVGAVAISMLPHNSANLSTLPPQSTFRSALTTCVSSARSPGAWGSITQIKSFVRPSYVSTVLNIHIPLMNKEVIDSFGAIYVDEHRQEIRDVTRRENTTYDYVALHHFAVGTRDYFDAKVAKGRSQGPGKWPVDENYWNNYHLDVETYECTQLAEMRP